LSALAHSTDEKTDAQDRCERPAKQGEPAGENTGVCYVLLSERSRGFVEIERAEIKEHEHHPDEETEVAHTVRDERLHRRSRSKALIEVIANQQIATQIGRAHV